jgi:N-acetylglucosaminyldiphosphoundecaprenol N-acetyl-beta-D-mannosaminyltransferase
VLGVRVDVVTMAHTLAVVTGWIAAARAPKAGGGKWRTRQVVTLNPEMVVAARADPELRDVINAADLVVPDGIGVVWASRLRGVKVAERVAGVDIVTALARLGGQRGWRLFLLGATPGIAGRAAEYLRASCPGVTIAGTHAGSADASEDEVTAGLVHASDADIVCVAYGSPAQERWIARNRDRLGCAVAIGVGGTLDFLAGAVPRAPAWMRRAGLEWAYRLWRQPWRWRRMLALPRFAIAVLWETGVDWAHLHAPLRHVTTRM